MKVFQLWVEVFEWIDGDTFKGILDHGCGIYSGSARKPLRYRCSGIDAPELPTSAAVISRRFACSLVPSGQYPCISTGLDLYGRPLLDIRLPDDRLFSEVMVAEGMAKIYRKS